MMTTLQYRTDTYRYKENECQKKGDQAINISDDHVDMVRRDMDDNEMIWYEMRSDQMRCEDIRMSIEKGREINKPSFLHTCSNRR